MKHGSNEMKYSTIAKFSMGKQYVICLSET